MSALAAFVKSLRRWPGQKNSLTRSSTAVGAAAVDGGGSPAVVEIRQDGINSVVQVSHLIAQNPFIIFTRKIL